MTDKAALGSLKNIPIHDAFVKAAKEQEPVIVPLGKLPFPNGLTPKPIAFGSYSAGEKITGAVDVKADVLIVLYTDDETSALLEVFTGSKTWTADTKKKWCGYAHNFASIKPTIGGIDQNTALKDGLFGYLSAVKIGDKTVVLYKSELHPKQNGSKLPFVPVLKQLIAELKPSLVISTGTAGAIGSHVQCGDVAICSAARFHVKDTYPDDAAIDTMSAKHTELANTISVPTKYVQYAAENLTKLTLPALNQCHTKLEAMSGYGFVGKSTTAPKIYIAGSNPAPGPQPMAIVSADYLTVDDENDTEGLQALGIMNDTDDAFLFYAISQMSGTKPHWLSVRNASEPQIVAGANATPATLGNIAGNIYGIYQYCTTLNSALACWGVIAGLT